jgi:hypothetical protein
MRLILPIIAALLLAGCDVADFGPSDRFKDDFHYTLKPANRLSVETFNGEIEIDGWDEPSIDVTGVKYASTAESLNLIRIDVHESAAFAEIRTVRPNAFRGNQGARFLIRVPRGTVLDRIISSNGAIRVHDTAAASIHTSNGAIDIEDVSGRVDAGTSNGRVTVRLKDAPDGPTRISTSNGSVDLSMSKAPKNGITVGTSNGSITLDLPGNTKARLDAQTSHSPVSTDFDVAENVRSGREKNRLEGTIGAGGPFIELRTSNGGIHLRKSDATAN